ncbi:MAG: NACHT domain-containing protein [Microcoleaceae cyanobacterium]
MNQETRRRGFLASSEGVKQLKQAKTNKGYTYQQIAEKAHVGIDSVKRLFKPDWGVNVGEETIEAISNVLDLDPADIVEGWYPPSDSLEVENSSLETTIKQLRRRFDEMLQKQKQLTTNGLMAKNGITFYLDEVFTPLSLIPENQPIPKEYNTSGKEDSILYKVTKKEADEIELDDFLQKVIGEDQTLKTQGKRLVIAGEAGSGKTTILIYIWDWLLKRTEYLPIYISLAEMGKKRLDQYLIENWIKEVAQVIESPSPQWSAALQKILKSGKVYLLLDGVDEMATPNGLHTILDQLRRWADNLPVIITCRLNSYNPNGIDSLDVYYTGNFELEKQIKPFINKWFSKNLKLGKELIEELDQLRPKIQDSIKNPLRLALLCYSWQVNQGKLPDTTAKLYDWFVEAFYIWKREHFSISLKQRQKLDEFLGRLAIRAIDVNESRFRLRQNFILKFLKEESLDPDLFDLALKLGWLNKVGEAVENPTESVYGFFHPTFQEYFAAKIINDWQFFLKHDNKNPILEEDFYRAFQPQWKQVILFWFGREDINKQSKEDFINALVEFEDCCDDYYFYWQKGIDIVYDSFHEFCQCSLNEIIHFDEYGYTLRIDEVLPFHKQIYSFFTSIWFVLDYFSWQYQPKETYYQPYLNQHQNELKPIVDDIDKINDINNLMETISDAPSGIIRWIAVRRLANISVANSDVITNLISCLYNQQNEHIYRAIAFILTEVDPENIKVVNCLINLLINNQNRETRQVATLSLISIMRKDSDLITIVIAKILKVMEQNNQLDDCCQAILWHCAQNMTYPEFYYAWHSNNSTIQNLENQITDISTQLQPTTKTYPIFINASPLKDETETQAIAQEIYNQIHQTVYPNDDNIPEVNNAPQLKRLIPKIKSHLHTQHLALIFQKSDPHPETITFCHKLTNTLHIAWLTDLPLDPPLRGFPPNQPNLKSALETWLKEI